MRRFFLAVFSIFILAWGLSASAQQACFGPSCSVSGSGTTTLTAGITATSGCTNGAFLYSLTSLMRCGTVMTTDGTNITATIPFLIPQGTVTAPAIGVAADADGSGTGFYSGAANDFRVTVNGIYAMAWGATYIAMDRSIRLDSAKYLVWSSAGSLSGADDTGLRRVAAGVVGSTLGGADNGWMQNSAGELALNANYTNATTTFSNTGLSAALISNRTYTFTANLILSDSTAADGVKIDFNGGSAAMTVFNVSCMMTNDTTGATVAFTAATAAALATTINAAAMASTGNHMLVCNGGMVPSGNGTFILRAAQNAHTTGTLTITRASWLSVRDARPL